MPHGEPQPASLCTEDVDCSSSMSSDDSLDDLELVYRHDMHARRDGRNLILFTAATCASMLLALRFFHLNYSMPTTTTSNARVRPMFVLGNSSERLLLCTLGKDATHNFAYPLDGVCNFIVYTHVRYEEENSSFFASSPASVRGWNFFVLKRPQYRATRLLPSQDWTMVSPMSFDARSVNRTLLHLGMVGLAFLNVRISVGQVPLLTAILRSLARGNPGMFLALGVSFHGLHDGSASRLVPTDLMDQLVTPLSLFVLETHLPTPREHCTADVSTGRGPFFEQQEDRLTFEGAASFLAQPALRYVDPVAMPRCISVQAGVLVFHVPRGIPRVGARCTQWTLQKLATFCRLTSVRLHAEAQAMYGHTGQLFFTFESSVHVVPKVQAVLRVLLRSELPTCLAVYSLDLDAFAGLCSINLDRPSRLVYTAYNILKFL
ncbi:hypothetical protein HPB48_012632 [Haemaphysalis longicornis]|uniref:Uncharacterized protein n=1 Tax=Haemaphysalis longicornis TaxID=44386 RepID=A0A9J6FQG4_HAELO|nr:hypothetical protein HPB48_012632 [Haemaphysalis longicornis]